MPDSRPSPPLAARAIYGGLVLYLMALVIAPMGILLVYSFCDRDELGQIEFTFTLDNYRRLMDPLYLRILWRSVEYAGLATLLCVVIGWPVGWYLSTVSDRWRRRLVLAVMIPFWTSFIVRLFAWIGILKQQGSLNGLLLATGLIPAVFPKPLELLYTPAAVMIGLVHAYLPFVILPVFAALEKIDPALTEAALDLGATPLRTVARIAFPLSMPGLRSGAMLVFVPCIAAFAVTDLLGGSRTLLAGNVIANQFGQARDWPFGSAMSVVLLAIFLVAMGLASLHRRWRRV